MKLLVIGVPMWVGWVVNLHTWWTVDISHLESLTRLVGILCMPVGALFGWADILL